MDGDIVILQGENKSLKEEVEQFRKVVDELTSKRDEQLNLNKQLQSDHDTQLNVLQEKNEIKR